jgi:hypothetical protein
MKKSALDVLLENKKEYTHHLCQLLTEPLYAELQSIYMSTKEKISEEKILEQFQDNLSKIPHWNLDQVTALKDRLNIRMNCSYFTDLLKATFMVYMKIHMATLEEHQLQSSNIKIKVPSTEVFLHRTLVAVARYLWRKPYLMYHKLRSLDKQRNVLQCENYIHKAVTQTIQNSLPLTEIFQLLAQETHVHKPSSVQSESESSESESSEEEEEEEEEHEHKEEIEEEEDEEELKEETESESDVEEEQIASASASELESESELENIPIEPDISLNESVGIKPIESESDIAESEDEDEDETESEEETNMVRIKSLTVDDIFPIRKKSHESSEVFIAKEEESIVEMKPEDKKELQEALFNKKHHSIHKPKSIHVKVSKSRSKNAFF